MLRRYVMLIVALLVGLLLSACGTKPAPDVQAVETQISAKLVATQAVAEVATVPTAVSVPVRTVLVTATPIPATSTPAYSPAAKLIRNSPAGKCRWDVYISLTGFAPNSRITVTSNFDEVACATGEVVTGASWTEVYGTKTDANGRLAIGYLHEGTGDYRYVFADEMGNRASLPLTTEPEATATPRVKTTAAATAATPTPTSAPTAVPDPQAIVQSATLNLRGGPGQNYPVMGQVARGDKLYPVARVANCGWLQVGVLGQGELVWVVGSPQYVTLNVPCETLRIVDQLPPTPLPAPTAVPRPPTGLISRSGSSSGSGTLLVKNGTDSDGVVILVDLANNPIQAAYIRAGQSFQMTQIADGKCRLYFTKGEAWDAAAKEFTRNVTRQRFEDTLAFVTQGNQYTGYEVTLYGVAGGNAATENVPAGQFPAVP